MEGIPVFISNRGDFFPTRIKGVQRATGGDFLGT